MRLATAAPLSGVRAIEDLASPRDERGNVAVASFSCAALLPSWVDDLSKEALGFVRGTANLTQPKAKVEPEQNATMRAQPKSEEQQAPAKSSVNGYVRQLPVMVNLSIRVPAELQERLMRAAFERKLERQDPWTHQDCHRSAFCVAKEGGSLTFSLHVISLQSELPLPTSWRTVFSGGTERSQAGTVAAREDSAQPTSYTVAGLGYAGVPRSRLIAPMTLLTT